MTATDPSRLSGAVVASRFVPLLTTREDDVLITGTVHILAGEERQLTIAVVPDAEVLATADLRIRSEPWTSGARLPKAWWAPVESVTTRWPGQPTLSAEEACALVAKALAENTRNQVEARGALTCVDDLEVRQAR